MIKLVRRISVFLLVGITGALLMLPQNGASAAVVGFNAGHIIDDVVFTDSSSMSVQAIQNFLNSKVPACDTWGTKMYNSWQTRAQFAATIGQSPPFTCLKAYSENNLSAAQIIYNAAQTYQISPKVLLVLLQKEQALVTDEWPYTTQYRTATGFGCPDTSVCNSLYYGFTNQVNRAANMFHQIMIASPNWYTPYVVGNNYIQYNPNAACGGSNVFIVNRSTQALYNYTPYQPNQATLDAGWGTAPCGAYGNRNFYLYFTSWFGSVYSGESGVFKGDASGTVYVRSGEYKLAIPSMAVLQDFGYDPARIATISQARVDAIPNPPESSGLSSTIGYVLKTPSDTDTDGGAAYFVARGKKNVIKSMEQFNEFKFNVGDIRYVDMSFLDAIPTGNPLSNFIQMPDYTIMQVTGGSRRIIFDINSYNSLNPGGYFTTVSEPSVGHIPGGDPVSSRSVVLKSSSADPIYVYSGDKYYFIPSMMVYECLGVNQGAGRDMIILPPDRISSTIKPVNSLSCSATLGSTDYVFNGNERYTSEPASGITPTTSLPPSMTDLVETYTNRGALKQYVKAKDSSAIWSLTDGQRKAIPSAVNYALFGSPAYDVIPGSVVDHIDYGGIALANRALVKSEGQSAVYVMDNGKRYLVPSADVFDAIGYNWSLIETYPDQQLGAYPLSSEKITPYYVDSSQNLFVLSQKSCYTVPKEYNPAYNITLTPTSYRKDTLLPVNLNNCKPATKIIKSTSSSTVYILENGRKLPFASWSTLVNYTNSYNPPITVLSNDLVAQYPLGPILR